MKILVLNGSPKGKNSTTLQTVRYLQTLHPEHRFAVLPVGQHIRRYEQDFSPARKALAGADVVLFCYPVYTFLVPYQLQQFLELVRPTGWTSPGRSPPRSPPPSISTTSPPTGSWRKPASIWGCGWSGASRRTWRTSSPEKARRRPGCSSSSCCSPAPTAAFFRPPPARPARAPAAYQPTLPQAEKRPGKEVVIVTCCGEEAPTLAHMVQDFQAALPYPSRVVNLQDFPFRGGCLGVCAAPSRESASTRRV